MITSEQVGGDGAVGLVTIARSEKANALDAQHWWDLAGAVTDLDTRGLRAIVIAGQGRTFCAGGDLDETDYDSLLKGCEATVNAITEAAAPVIAHVNGPAIGAGLQLAVACDLRVASPTARFSIPAASISKPAHPTLIRRIVAHVGVGAARAMLLGGDALDLDRARALGLVDRLGDLDAAIEWATAIAGYAPLVVEYFKRELIVADEAGTSRYEAFMQVLLASDDFAEAGRAHGEKRAPRFVGR